MKKGINDCAGFQCGMGGDSTFLRQISNYTYIVACMVTTSNLSQSAESIITQPGMFKKNECEVVDDVLKTKPQIVHRSLITTLFERWGHGFFLFCFV